MLLAPKEKGSVLIEIAIFVTLLVIISMMLQIIEINK
jgi:hypothetical protein